MNPLNEIYGEGMSAALRKALPGKLRSYDEVRVGEYARVNVTWPNGSVLKIDCWADRVHFAHLDSRRKRLYTDLCDSLPPLFKERGVERFTAAPANEDAAQVLLKRGEWRLGPRGLIWEL